MSVSLPSSLNLDEESKIELTKFIENEQSKARIQQSVHTMTDLCWDKCITKIGNRLDSNEESCLKNCVERFLDTSIFIVSKLQKQGNQF
ncbi:Mitochondrial import inner membrane translocase subunit tim8 [Entomophthora muscae]|uniref:Mitochondrial import inner membrane translocase subunit tim8 n=1 Tax=Entomophthora muscae TaxID=34485 RepID=A0ACC2TBT4_9FUNG|nr:Mitochondrial import inner membrane translocase subunit tim8 [Entomophthora muscae]